MHVECGTKTKRRLVLVNAVKIDGERMLGFQQYRNTAVKNCQRLGQTVAYRAGVRDSMWFKIKKMSYFASQIVSEILFGRIALFTYFCLYLSLFLKATNAKSYRCESSEHLISVDRHPSEAGKSKIMKNESQPVASLMM